MRMRSVLVGVVGAVLIAQPTGAQERGTVEMIEVKGIIDGSVERSVLATIAAAERADAELVVLQIDSRGVVDRARTARMQRAIRDASIPVVAWVGPPGARAENAAALLVEAADISSVAPGARVARSGTLDLRASTSFSRSSTRSDVEASGIADLLERIDGRKVDVAGGEVSLDTNPDEVTIRFHKLDLFGRALHAAAQPSITYLLLLLALVGLVFELFHPSTGPAGVSGLAALALALYGIATLGGSWLALGLIVAGIAAFCVDLRFESLGPFSIGGLIALIAGSVLLFSGPYLRVNPWVLAFGIIGMTMFLVGAMTRVLRDLRAIARGELEVRDAHHHPDEDLNGELT